ncbi:four helix bundle protein [Segetibacter aerophilus]|uniref:Four helix bundle protein n=1 Tax=Segetibacter aerophilus TaxID=670293 RepID=A0A512BDM3_9BACT|nr:four helix bundle protein [Segetibacter aerophilus]GEO09967.1 four helix bundle protein [Segetibacter aerophilus]
MTSYKKLEAWKKAMLLIKEVYFVCKSYPKEELFALTSQTKRAVVSIAANIAEGIGRNYKKDTIQFLHIARGSLYEVETLLNIAVMVEIIQEEKFRAFESIIDEEIRILNGLINSYEIRTELK